MADKITKAQLENLEDSESFDRREFNDRLEEYTGIIAEPRTMYMYFDAAGNYVGNSDDDVMSLLERAYVEVASDE